MYTRMPFCTVDILYELADSKLDLVQSAAAASLRKH